MKKTSGFLFYFITLFEHISKFLESAEKFEIFPEYEIRLAIEANMGEVFKMLQSDEIVCFLRAF